MDFNLDQALNEVFDTVRAGGVARGVKRLLAYCRKEDPDSREWAKLQKLPFEQDAQAIAQGIERAFRSGEITAQYRGFYFGLDGLNMPDGKAIEFGCSPAFDPKVHPGKWAEQCNLYIRTLKSKVLSAAYRIVEGAGIGDYVVCLGYAGLALRAAFEGIDPKVLSGKTKSRGVCWGFHDGDLFNLGTLTSKGFSLNLPDPKPALPVLPVPQRQASLPHKNGAARWIQLAEEFASQSPSPLERTRAMASVVFRYCEAHEYESAQKCLAELVNLMETGSEFKDDDLFKMDMEWIHGVTQNLSGATAKPFIPAVLFAPDDDAPMEGPAENQRVDSAVKKALAAAKKGTTAASQQVQEAFAELIARSTGAIRRPAASEAFRQLLEALVGLGHVKEAQALAKKVNIGDDFVEMLWRSNHVREYRAALQERFPKTTPGELDLMNGHIVIWTYKERANLQARLKDTEGIKRTLKAAEEFAKLVAGCRHAPLGLSARVYGDAALIARTAGNVRKSDALFADAKRAGLRVTDDFADAGILEDAIRSARRIRGRESKRQELGKLLAQAGRESEAEALISQCKTPETKVDLALRIARHLIRVIENSESHQ